MRPPRGRLATLSPSARAWYCVIADELVDAEGAMVVGPEPLAVELGRRLGVTEPAERRDLARAVEHLERVGLFRVEGAKLVVEVDE
jgi:hypothetical protein